MEAVRPVVLIAFNEEMKYRDDDENGDDGADGFGVHNVIILPIPMSTGR